MAVVEVLGQDGELVAAQAYDFGGMFIVGRCAEKIETLERNTRLQEIANALAGYLVAQRALAADTDH